MRHRDLALTIGQTDSNTSDFALAERSKDKGAAINDRSHKKQELKDIHLRQLEF